METFRESSRGVALNTPESCRRPKRFRGKPVATVLGRKAIHQNADFCIDLFPSERDIGVWCAKIAFILRNLVFQDKVVSEGVPRQLIHNPVILVHIVTPMGEHNVRHNLGF